jgi:hypothetical protein
MNTKTEVKHTPRLELKAKGNWFKIKNGGEHYGSAILSKDKTIVMANAYSHTDPNEAMERAAFIVRAVNSHEELLAVLKGAEKAIRKALPFVPADNEAHFVGEWLDEVKAAIDKAEGK